ncbi:hypothetical protein [Pedobacter sp. UC225_65]|uniref:hypothetical protein n=1 Tax=Pedobacter sp. UC225_65 TaxID=3350173 RepID=UPI00366CC8A6
MKINATLIFVLLLMILSSLFTEASIKGWIFLYEFELDLFKSLFMPKSKFVIALLAIFIITSHLVVCLLPFLTNNRNFKRLLIIAPMVFVGSFSIVSGLIFLLLIPFIFFWLIALLVNRNNSLT